MQSRWLLGLSLLLMPVVAAPGQPARLPGEVRRTAERLDEAAELERAGRHDAALDAYLKVRDDSPDDLVPLPGGALLWPARRVIDARVVANPELRERHRRRSE